MSKFANVLLDAEYQKKKLNDECQACGTSRREMRLNGYKGCRFCRNSGISSEPLGLESFETRQARATATRNRLEPSRLAHEKWEKEFLREQIEKLGLRRKP